MKPFTAADAEKAFINDLKKDNLLTLSSAYSYKMGYLQCSIDKDIQYLERISQLEEELKNYKEQIREIVKDRDEQIQDTKGEAFFNDHDY